MNMKSEELGGVGVLRDGPTSRLDVLVGALRASNPVVKEMEKLGLPSTR